MYRLRSVRVLLLIAILFVAGCASQTGARGTFGSDSAFWAGRLAVRVADATTQQAYSAGFELTGSALRGSLVLTSVLGSTLARLQWSETSASLQTTGEAQQFASLAELVQQATGTDLPLASLFFWLRGEAANAPGWEADLSGLPEGRLSARSSGAQKQSEIKIVLER
jgi:outer membrane lipoprotein LolB